MRINIFKPARPAVTHEGAPAAVLTAEERLRRSVLSCLLFEDEFYEDGVAIADRIAASAAQVAPSTLAALAVEARARHNLRHAPLLLLCALAQTGRGSSLVAETVERVVSRADEISELVALYWRSGKRPLSKQLKLGLARAFAKFDAYQLAKYDRAGPVRLRDVLFLVHAKPKDEAQAQVWRKLADGALPSPDTWEVALSAGADKRQTFERLIREGRLGYLALLRNLRSMAQVGCDEALVQDAILARRGAERVLPFRYVAAARAAPRFEAALDRAMMDALAEAPKLSGRTVVSVDVSGSMQARLSQKGDLTRMDAACALAAICREMCEDPVIYATAGNDATRVHATQLVPARRGMALVDAVAAMSGPLGGGGIFLTQCMGHIHRRERRADRIVVVTDEQDCDNKPGGEPAKAVVFASRAYMINVGSYRNGIGYGPKWAHIDGFSEAVLRFIQAHEAPRAA